MENEKSIGHYIWTMDISKKKNKIYALIYVIIYKKTFFYVALELIFKILCMFVIQIFWILKYIFNYPNI